MSRLVEKATTCQQQSKFNRLCSNQDGNDVDNVVTGNDSFHYFMSCSSAGTSVLVNNRVGSHSCNEEDRTRSQLKG